MIGTTIPALAVAGTVAPAPNSAKVRGKPVTPVGPKVSKKGNVGKPAAAAKAVVTAKRAAAAKPVAKPAVAKKAAKTKQASPKQPSAKAAAPKAKLVRDSFTMPQQDFNLIAVLKDRALTFKRPTKKSELLRAGLQVLEGLPSESLMSALERLTPLKTGRPKSVV